MNNYAAEMEDILWDLHNSSDHAKDESYDCFTIHLLKNYLMLN